MCGVIGYVGKGATPQFLFNGLKRLEYRGYDSAGIAMAAEGGIKVVKAEGKLSALERLLGELPERASAGIGHAMGDSWAPLVSKCSSASIGPDNPSAQWYHRKSCGIAGPA
jgi:glucosamine 6-phosphate synthetase-like amidotransferase/phosphosugar isomerase protein